MTKDIDLVGLGNGLVDIQYVIEDKDLEIFKLKKGEMRLTMDEQPDDILNKMSHIKYTRCSGGSAANSIIAFAALGGKTAYKTVLGNDELGRFYEQEFKDLKIELNTQLLDDNPTGSCFVFITPDSERTMLTSLGATARFSGEHINEDYIKRAKWLYIEGYKFSEPASTEAIQEAVNLAKKYDTKIAVTFSDVFIIENFRENLEFVVNNAELVFCNEQEAKAYTKEDDPQKAFDKLAEHCPNIVVTYGKNGSLVRYENIDYKIPAYVTKALDTTGAGDMYAGCFLYGLIYDKDINKAGNLASYASSRVVSQLGARLKEDLKEIRTKVYNELIK